MSKEDVLNAFQTDFNNPGSLKSGEYLQEQIVKRARWLFPKDPSGVIEVLRQWLHNIQEPHTMLAVKVIEELAIEQFRDELLSLKSDIEKGKIFMPFYVRDVDDALSALKKRTEESRD